MAINLTNLGSRY